MHLRQFLFTPRFILLVLAISAGTARATSWNSINELVDARGSLIAQRTSDRKSLDRIRAAQRALNSDLQSGVENSCVLLVRRNRVERLLKVLNERVQKNDADWQQSNEELQYAKDHCEDCRPENYPNSPHNIQRVIYERHLFLAERGYSQEAYQELSHRSAHYQGNGNLSLSESERAISTLTSDPGLQRNGTFSQDRASSDFSDLFDLREEGTLCGAERYDPNRIVQYSEPALSTQPLSAVALPSGSLMDSSHLGEAATVADDRESSDGVDAYWAWKRSIPGTGRIITNRTEKVVKRDFLGIPHEVSTMTTVQIAYP